MSFESTSQPTTASLLWLQELPRHIKMLVIALADATLLICMVLLAYSIRISSLEFPVGEKLAIYMMGPLLSILFAGLWGVYMSAARGYSARLERNLFISQAMVPFAWSGFLLIAGTQGFPRSTVLIYFLLSFMAMVGVRRVAYSVFTAGLGEMSGSAKKVAVAIYGAGKEGLLIAEALRNSRHYKVTGFLETDYTLFNGVVSGVRVYPIDELAAMVERLEPTEVIIAKPQANRAARRNLVEMFSTHGLKVKIAPGVEDVMAGQVNIADIREINLEDLLGRDPVPPDDDLMKTAIFGKVVMVTGAGGSIGSELARQAFAITPAKLVLVENNEFSLFEIHRELEARIKSSAGLNIVPVLADVKDHNDMLDIITQHGVEIIFHAAAYKHVRLVQENMAAGINNNVLGTFSVAKAALKANVSRFILISTDKAVRPTGIMGASKRLAEMHIQALANGVSTKGRSKTVFSMVRFGNVLGSTGSVVPLFKEQIAAGGPLMVTHPDVTRYFMLIPEAAQLVIQAGAMATGGEVFVLDMGEPIKILQLAKTMVELAGLQLMTSDNPNGDIEIQFVGLRDGEKLFEELQIGRDVCLTSHDRIMRSNEIWLPQRKLEVEMKAIESVIASGDMQAAATMVLELANLGAEA
jgi:FlaA1/EpsC-like NDP-sugar epimerase